MKNKVKMCMYVYLYKFYKDFLFFELSTDDPTRPLYKIYKFTRSPNPQNFPLFFIHFASPFYVLRDLYKLCIFSPIFINVQFLTFRLL